MTDNKISCFTNPKDLSNVLLIPLTDMLHGTAGLQLVSRGHKFQTDCHCNVSVLYSAVQRSTFNSQPLPEVNSFLMYATGELEK